MTDGDVWIFGYGSLCWKAGFEHEESAVGFIIGHQRRFWQSSMDHRGTPEFPGRVVTLVKTGSPSDRSWGMVYRVAQEKWPEVQNYLDYREKGGYTLDQVDVFSKSGSILTKALVYVGTTDNPNFVGPEPLHVIASRIAVSVGPSGVNTEYLFELCEWMRAHAGEEDDDHLFELEKQVRLRITSVEESEQ